MRRLLDAALFWTTFGGVLVVGGGVFVGVGANDASAASLSVWYETTFVGGIVAMAVGGLMLLWSLALFIAHRHVERHVAAGSAAAGSGAMAKPRRIHRRDRRLDLIDHHRVGEELLAKGGIAEAVAQVWTESVHALLQTRSLGRRWFAVGDVE